MSLSPGTRLGSYDVIALIGQGGMGEVYQGNSTVRCLAEPQSAFLIAQYPYVPNVENLTAQGLARASEACVTRCSGAGRHYG